DWNRDAQAGRARAGKSAGGRAGGERGGAFSRHARHGAGEHSGVAANGNLDGGQRDRGPRWVPVRAGRIGQWWDRGRGGHAPWDGRCDRRGHGEARRCGAAGGDGGRPRAAIEVSQSTSGRPGAGGAQTGQMSVRYERRGAAVWLTIDRADAANALSRAVVGGVRSGVAKASAEDGGGAVGVAGAGGKAFSGGAAAQGSGGTDAG